jgi:hypothetical protein
LKFDWTYPVVQVQAIKVDHCLDTNLTFHDPQKKDAGLLAWDFLRITFLPSLFFQVRFFPKTDAPNSSESDADRSLSQGKPVKELHFFMMHCLTNKYNSIY